MARDGTGPDTAAPPPVGGSGRGGATSVGLMAETGAVLEIEAADDGLILRGEIDAHTAPRLREALAERITQSESDVRLEFGGVTFMDSSGLRVILDGASTAREQDREVVLVAPTPSVRRLIEITGLADHLVVQEGGST